jgi:hypothetical protein
LPNKEIRIKTALRRKKSFYFYFCHSHSIVDTSDTLINKGIQRFKFHLVVFLSC